MKTSKYVVIGGQYDSYTYGTAKTLTGAKRLASSHVEYWDNWQGWHCPATYPRRLLRRMAQGVGCLQTGKGSLERRRITAQHRPFHKKERTVA